MRLLYVTTNIESSGGVQRVLSVKLNYLSEIYNYDVHLINTHGGKGELFYDFSPKITFYFIDQSNRGFSRLLRYCAGLNSLIKKIKPDIIINCDNGLKGAFLPNIIGGAIPIVYEDHLSNRAKGNSFFLNIKLKLIFIVHKNNSHKYYKIVRFSPYKRNGLKDNIVVIPNPLSFGLSAQSSRLHNKRIIAVGRCTYEKGYERMLKIWRQILPANQEWMLEIYGEGDWEALLKLAQELGISENVSFKGPVRNVREKFLSSSILINTSYFESFGLSILEAMCYGLPVVAFESDGPKLLIDHTVNGFLIAQNNESEFKKILLNLMDNMSLRERIGSAAKESVTVFEKQLILKQWHDLFQEVKSLG